MVQYFSITLKQIFLTRKHESDEAQNDQFLLHKNQTIDFGSKSIDRLLYDGNIGC